MIEKVFSEPQISPLEETSAKAPTRLARAEQRRKQVLDAARIVFRDRGFHGASMAQIAAVAAMSVGHIYRYFKNKDAVIVAIVEQDLQLAQETIDLMLQDPAGMPAAMLASVEAGVIKMLDRQDAALFMEVMAEATRNPRVAQSATRQREAAQSCVGMLFEGGGAEARPFTPAQAIDLVTLVFSGLRVRAIQAPPADASALAATIRAFMMQLMEMMGRRNDNLRQL